MCNRLQGCQRLHKQRSPVCSVASGRLTLSDRKLHTPRALKSEEPLVAVPTGGAISRTVGGLLTITASCKRRFTGRGTRVFTKGEPLPACMRAGVPSLEALAPGRAHEPPNTATLVRDLASDPNQDRLPISQMGGNASSKSGPRVHVRRHNALAPCRLSS